MPLDSPAQLPDSRLDHVGCCPTDDSGRRDSHEMLPSRPACPTPVGDLERGDTSIQLDRDPGNGWLTPIAVRSRKLDGRAHSGTVEHRCAARHGFVESLNLKDKGFVHLKLEGV